MHGRPSCDVSVEAQVEAALTATLQRFGRLDVVVNNAGLMSFKPLNEFTGEDWNRILLGRPAGRLLLHQACLHRA